MQQIERTSPDDAMGAKRNKLNRIGKELPRRIVIRCRCSHGENAEISAIGDI